MFTWSLDKERVMVKFNEIKQIFTYPMSSKIKCTSSDLSLILTEFCFHQLKASSEDRMVSVRQPLPLLTRITCRSLNLWVNMIFRYKMVNLSCSRYARPCFPSACRYRSRILQQINLLKYKQRLQRPRCRSEAAYVSGKPHFNYQRTTAITAAGSKVDRVPRFRFRQWAPWTYTTLSFEKSFWASLTDRKGNSLTSSATLAPSADLFYNAWKK